MVGGQVLLAGPYRKRALQHGGRFLNLKTATVTLEMVVLDGSGCCRYRQRYVTAAVFCCFADSGFHDAKCVLFGGSNVPHCVALLGLKSSEHFSPGNSP